MHLAGKALQVKLEILRRKRSFLKKKMTENWIIVGRPQTRKQEHACKNSIQSTLEILEVG